jgi:hypothetical protein
MTPYYILEPGTPIKPGDEYYWCHQWHQTGYGDIPVPRDVLYRRRAKLDQYQCQWIPVGEKEPVNEYCPVLVDNWDRPFMGRYDWGTKAWLIWDHPGSAYELGKITHFCDLTPFAKVDRVQRIQDLLDNTKLSFPPGLAQALAGIT